jgi:large subunit ribosomal protein L18
MNIKKRNKSVARRKSHVRKKVSGTSERPRLSVFRSNRHLYAQIIDDTAGATLVSASTLAKLKSEGSKKVAACNIKAAEMIGEMVAKQALSVGIKCVCFDRNRYKFHGRVKHLADAARKAGLVF